MALIVSFVISMVTSKRTDYIKNLVKASIFWAAAAEMLSGEWSGVMVLLSGLVKLLHRGSSSKRVKLYGEKVVINGIPTSKILFQIHTDSSFVVCCSLTCHFFIPILISKYLLRESCSTVTSTNPICSLRAGSREEACDNAGSKQTQAHGNAGMRDDLESSFHAVHSCPVSCKGMLNWPLQRRTILN